MCSHIVPSYIRDEFFPSYISSVLYIILSIVSNIVLYIVSYINSSYVASYIPYLIHSVSQISFTLCLIHSHFHVSSSNYVLTLNVVMASVMLVIIQLKE